MTYLETKNLVTVKEEISKFQSSYSDKNTKTHIVVQSINGYQIKLNEFDESTKELHSFIVNQTFLNSENQDITKNDLVYLITSSQLSLSEEQSLNIANINNLEEAQVQINIEVKFKENLLNLIKV